MWPWLFWLVRAGERLERDPCRGDRRRRTACSPGPRVAGAEPAKSTTKRPSPIVTVTSMRTGSSVMPSSSSQSTAVHDPCGSAATPRRVARSAWARISSMARVDHVATELGHDVEQAPLAGPQRRHLGVHVADHQLGHAAVEADQLDDLAVEHAALERPSCPGRASPPGARRSSRARSPGPWRRGPSSGRARTRTPPARRRRRRRRDRARTPARTSSRRRRGRRSSTGS